MNNAYRQTALFSGILFVLATATGIASVPVLHMLNNPDYMIIGEEQGSTLILGSVLKLAMAFFCAGIGIVLYPVLKKFNATLAAGAMGFRLIEGVFHAAAVLGIFPIVALSAQPEIILSSSGVNIEMAEVILQSIREEAVNIALIAWLIGASMYYIVFFTSQLIPRWLSVWGLAAVLPAFLAVMLDVFNITDSMSLSHSILNVPIAFQEMTLAVWLIFVGFNKSVKPKLA